MKLYYLPGACSLASHIVLEWIGEPYEAVAVSRSELKSPDYLKLNPAGAVPVLEDADLVLTENTAILHYLADLYPQHQLAGGDAPRDRAEVNRWLGFLNSEVHRAFKPIFGPALFLDDEDMHPLLAAKARARVHALLQRIDRHLDGRHWLAAPHRTLVDPYLYVMLRWTGRTDVDIAELGALQQFARRMEDDRGVQATLRAEGL